MSTPRRADAVRSREKLVRAFAELVRERGEDVPFVEVARRAGVGQGTLYRHFPDRGALVAAMFDAALADFERSAAAAGEAPDGFERLLTAAATSMARVHSLSTGLLVGDRRGAPAERTVRLFRGPLRAAQHAGRIRADLRPDDVLTVLAMIEGVLSGVVEPALRAAAAEHAVGLVLRGLRA
jgi:AcrR family transcriptional regulator